MVKGDESHEHMKEKNGTFLKHTECLSLISNLKHFVSQVLILCWKSRRKCQVFFIQIAYRGHYYNCEMRIFVYTSLACFLGKYLMAFELKRKDSKRTVTCPTIGPGRTLSILVAAEQFQEKILSPQNDIECVVFLNALLQGDQEAFIQ